MKYNLYLVFDISPYPLHHLKDGVKKGTILSKNSYKGKFWVEMLYDSSTRKIYKRKSVCIGRTNDLSEALDITTSVLYAFSQGKQNKGTKKAIELLGEKDGN